VFLTSFYLVGGWVGKPDTPQKNTSFALGMRRACASMVQRTEAKRSPQHADCTAGTPKNRFV